MFDTSLLFASLILGCIGMGYTMYGKSAQRYAYLLSGLSLMIFPYFVSNLLYTRGIGVVLIIFPFLVDF